MDVGIYLSFFVVVVKLVGLSVAANVLEKHPEKKVVILERGLLPTGASTKNAGIAGTNGKELKWNILWLL